VRTVGSRSDLILLAAVVLLLGIGASMVYSASLVVGYSSFGDDTFFLVRQIAAICIGLTAMVVLALIDYHRWQRYSALILLAGCGLLLLVLLPGLGGRAYGSSRWIRLPFFQLQPSELIKPALVLYMADWLASKGGQVREFKHCSLPFLLILGAVCTLVVIEPDFGTTVVIALTAVSIFFVAGANSMHFGTGVLLMSSIAYFIMTQAAYRNDRIRAWMQPFEDKQGVGWHTVQTLIALGSGGLTGLGIGASRQKHLWLANPHTDAILAVIGEEFGLLGTLTVMTLFGLIFWRGLLIAYRARDAYGRLLAAGLTTMIFWQAAINVAVVTNAAPYTGVTLPFVSYGGTSTVVSLAAIGLLLSVARFRDRSGIRRVEGLLAGVPGSAGPWTRRRRERPAAEPAMVSVGQLDAPISLAARRGGRASGAGRGR
jgi:cell division protein FtsW